MVHYFLYGTDFTLQRNEISRLPEVKGDNPVKKNSSLILLAIFNLILLRFRPPRASSNPLSPSTRRTSLTYIELHAKAGKMAAAQFLRNLVKAVPYSIHTVLIHNGIQFTKRTRDIYGFGHIFNRVRDESGIEHRLNKLKHPWTKGQV